MTIRAVARGASSSAKTGSAVPFLREFPAADTLVDAVRLVKLRTDVTEFAVYTPIHPNGIDWARWYFTNRFNPGNIGCARLTRATLAKLYDTSLESPVAVNVSTGTQAQVPDVSVPTASGTRSGTWTSSATVSGVTDIRYSTVTGDYVEYTISGVTRIVARCYGNTANGGVAAVSIKAGGLEISDSFFTLRPGKLASRRLLSGFLFIPLADGLNPATTYTVRMTVDASNPASGRLYDGGLLGYNGVDFNAVGPHGITQTSPLTTALLNTSAMLYPGMIAVHEVTNARKVVWRHVMHSTHGQVSFKVYNNAGAEIDPGLYTRTTYDGYAASSVLADVEVAAGLPLGTYYLHVQLLTTKNAAGTNYQMYDYGAIGVDTATAGNPASSLFDDLGVTDGTGSLAAITFEGTGNVEAAIKLRKTTSAAGVDDEFVGGTHGNERTITSLAFTLDGGAVDYAGGAAGAEWNGASLSWSYGTVLEFHNSADAVANATYSHRLDRTGFWHDFTRTLTADATVSEDYALMVQAPKPGNAFEGGYGGGMELVVVKPGPDEVAATADDNSSIGSEKGATEAVLYNDSAMVHCKLLNLGEVRAQFSGVTAGVTPRSFVQDRNDGYVKFYVRAHSFPASGTLVASGNTYTAKRVMRVCPR